MMSIWILIFSIFDLLGSSLNIFAKTIYFLYRCLMLKLNFIIQSPGEVVTVLIQAYF